MSEPVAAERPVDAVKRVATLTARFALRGFEVRKVESGFLVIRWNLTKHAETVEDLERFARVVGAA